MDNDSIGQKLKEILISNNLINVKESDLSFNEDLSKYGLHSIAFIRLILAIESEFDIEFDDSDLDFSNDSGIRTFASLLNYIENKLLVKN